MSTLAEIFKAETNNHGKSMLIEQPTSILGKIFKRGLFRKDPAEHAVYLTFDDGPIPIVTPWVLDLLDKYDIKATFFVVGDNVKKYPDIFEQVVKRGHKIGNHTFNHVHGLKMRSADYTTNVDKCNTLFKTNLFRPPHGVLRPWEMDYLAESYQIVFWDVVTRDYSKRINADRVFKIVKKYTRNGSIIVFHDSLRSRDRLYNSLARSIEWLISQGYEFRTL